MTTAAPKELVERPEESEGELVLPDDIDVDEPKTADGDVTIQCCGPGKPLSPPEE